MTTDVVLRSAPEPVLPWTKVKEEEDRYNKVLKRSLLLLLMLCLIGPWLPVTEKTREEAEKIPPRLARVVLEKKKVVKPPPPKQQQVKEKEPKEVKTAKKKKPMDKKTKAARKKASTVGVAAFSKQLSSLRSNLNVAKLKARNTTRSTGAAKKSTRSVLAKQSTATSGGVQTAALSANAGSSQLVGHSSSTIDSPIAGAGGNMGDASTGHRSKKKSSGRDMESIRRVFEQHKGAIYSMYTRALRKDPELEGKFVFELVIENDGSISSIKLVSSELGEPKLERKMLTRIRRINFGPASGKATTVKYQFDFIPS